MTTPQQLAYASEYIRTALAQSTLEAPDKAKANGTFEVLKSLWDAHKLGGPGAAQFVWETKIKPNRPDFALLEHEQTLLIHASELKYITKPEVQLDGYPFYRYAFNLLVGPSGSGKSFVALDYAGRIAQARSVVYVVGEGLHGYLDRWEAWKDYTGGSDGKLYFHKEPVQVVDDTALQNFIALVTPKEPELIILDTVARCAVGIEENSAKEMGILVDACDRMRRTLNCGLLAVHHSGKDGKIRGSSALFGAADAVLFQNKVEGRIALMNNADAGGKNKHAQELPTRYVRIVPHTVGEYQGAVVMPDESVIQERGDKLTSNQRAVLEVIDGHDKGISPKSIQDATGLRSSTIYFVIKALLKLKHIEQTDDDRYVITESGTEAM